MTKWTEKLTITWTHFYCNSSIESKKLLININTMPMLKLRSSTPRAPLSLHEETKREKEGEEKKKKGMEHLLRCPSKTWKKSNNFIYTRRISISIRFLFFPSHTGRTLPKSNAHTKDTLLSLSRKANKQQHSTRKIRTQAAERGAASSPRLPSNLGPRIESVQRWVGRDGGEKKKQPSNKIKPEKAGAKVIVLILKLASD